jgi:Cys-tRNA(Pro)/Cys-tRNA(Cys) deacylase
MAKTNNVTRFLTSKKVSFEIHELPGEKLSAIEAANHLGVDPRRMFKTIVALRADGGKKILALVSAGAQVEMKALARLLGGTKVKAASLSQAEEITGLQSGGISPLVLIGKGFEVVLDSSALNFESIYLSGGDRGLNLSMSPADLIRLTGAKNANISSM